MVAIFGADHIYRMNIAHMIAISIRHAGAHLHGRRDPRGQKQHASEFGVIEADPDNRILAFHEKNPDAPSIPGDPGPCFRLHGELYFQTTAAA